MHFHTKTSTSFTEDLKCWYSSSAVGVFGHLIAQNGGPSESTKLQLLSYTAAAGRLQASSLYQGVATRPDQSMFAK